MEVGYRTEQIKKFSLRPVWREFESYRKKSQYVEGYCLTIEFVNTGSVDALINGFPLPVGAQVKFEGNVNDFDVSKYKLDFDRGALSENREVFVIRTLLAD